MLRVNGGPANSGTRIIKDRGGPWTCEGCAAPENAAYWVTCPCCGKKRP